MFKRKRPLCDETWGEDVDAKCERPAVVTVDGTSYCAEHASQAPVSDR